MHINEGKGKIALFYTANNVLLTTLLFKILLFSFRNFFIPIFPSSSSSFLLFSLHHHHHHHRHHISIVFPPPPPPPPPPHSYCLPSTTTTFLFSSLRHHHRHHISIVFPPPPPPHFHCFPSSSMRGTGRVQEGYSRGTGMVQ